MIHGVGESLKAREGTLAETPFALLLHRIFVEQRSVVLELRKSQLEKRIAFEDGVPVGCRSNLLHETLGRFLVDRGRLTDAQCHEALAQSVRDGEPLGEVIVKRGLLQPFDLYKAMQQSTARKILDCFTWTDARYRFLGAPPAEDTPLKMNPAQLIVTAATTILPFEVVAQGLTFFDGQQFALVPEPPHDPAELRLHARDQTLLALLQRRPTFEDLVASGYSSEEGLRRLYALGVLGIVAFAEAVPDAPTPVPVAPTPLEKVDAASMPAGPEAEALTNAVMDAFLKHRTQDPFDLFRIKPTVPLPEIRRAYLVFAEKYRPARFTGALASVADKAEELFLAGARGWAQLADYEGRNLAIERRQRREEEAKRKKGDAGADFKIKTELLDAGEQFQEGLKYAAAEDWAAAANYLQFACDCDPGRARYRANLAWALYRQSPARAEKALQELAVALRADARCDEAHYFEGRIRAETGDLAGAEECYRRAIKAAPAEKKYTEALRQVGLARKK